MPYPRSYDRVKEYTKELLKAMIACQQKYPESNVEPLLKTLTPKELSIELKQQLEAFWKGHYPFNRLLNTGMDSLAWWLQFQEHSDARVLAVKLFYTHTLCEVKTDLSLFIRCYQYEHSPFSSTPCSMNVRLPNLLGLTLLSVAIKTRRL